MIDQPNASKLSHNYFFLSLGVAFFSFAFFLFVLFCLNTIYERDALPFYDRCLV